MKLIIPLTFGLFFCFKSFEYTNNDPNLDGENRKRDKRWLTDSYEMSVEQILPLKKLKRFPNGLNNREFEVDRNRISSLHNFVVKSGKTIGKLTLKNFDTSERVNDIWHHRLVKASKLDLRETIFDFSQKPEKPSLILDNCYDGWFPFEHFKIEGELVKEAIHLRNSRILCELTDRSLPKSLKLVDRFGSFAVRIDHDCSWRYWNFDVSNINLEEYNMKSRTDLNYSSAVEVASLKLKGFESNITVLKNLVVKFLRLDWIREVGLNGLDYEQGCLILEDTDPHGIFQLTDLRQLHYDKENFRRSAPFIINALNRPCLNSTEKVQLFEKFGIVALHILDSCPLKEKVLIIDGRQPFDYVTDRDDIRFLPGDTVFYARIRYLTEKDHLKNLDEWFKKIGYHNVREIGNVRQIPDTPEVTVSGSISTFVPFPYAERAIRNYKISPDSRFTLPIFYFRNNSGVDCQRRRVVNTLRRSIGKFSAASSRDCECGKVTNSEFFWTNCLAHRGTLEVTGSPTDEELSRFKNIRRIRDGQLWMHDTTTVSNLQVFDGLEEIQCAVREESKAKRKLSAVRIGSTNSLLETVDLPKLLKTEHCLRFVTIAGDEKCLPKYSESEWMQSRRMSNSVSVKKNNKKCVGYSGRGGGMTTELSHQLDDCDTIDGNLQIDGHVDDIQKTATALRNVRRINGNVVIKNVDSEYCRLLKHVKFIEGNFTYDNNPSLKQMTLSLLHVKGLISFTRVPGFCLELQNIRPVVEAFKRKHLNSDCAFHQESMLTDFEDRFADVETFSDLGIPLTLVVFVCYMMSNILVDQLKALNITRWREMTELDMRLKLDYTAYLDEDSSEEEPDVMTWKRKTMVKNRLDGRDIEGEKLQKEKKLYKENKKAVKFPEKMGALMRALKRKESDSEFSGQSWLKRKQRRKRKYEFARRDENIPFPVLIQSGESKWVGRTKEWQEVQREEIEQEEVFVQELNTMLRDIINGAEAEDIDRLMTITEMLEKKHLTKKKEIVSEYQKLEQLLILLNSQIEKGDKKKWEKWAKMRKRLRIRALAAFGDGEPIKLLEAPEEKIEESIRLNAGVQREHCRRKSGMFAKLIVSTMNWKPQDHQVRRRSTGNLSTKRFE